MPRLTCLILLGLSTLHPTLAPASNITLGAPGDTLTAAALMTALQKAAPGDTLVADSLVVTGPLDLPRAGIDRIDAVLQLNGTRFIDSVRADGVDFAGGIHGRGARFHTALSCRGARFNGLNYEGARFDQKADFSEAAFDGFTLFNRSRFDGPADFAVAFFNGIASFDSTRFAAGALFANATFKGWANFANAHFHGPASWRYSSSGWVTFAKARFDQTLDLSSASLEKRGDFRAARFDSAQVLLGGILSAQFLLDDWDQIRNRLFFIEGDWAQQDTLATNQITNLRQVATVYSLLQSQFRDQGLYEEENNCYYDLKQIERAYYYRRLDWHPASWWQAVKYTVLWATCGYGVRPQHTIWLGLALVLACALCYYQLGAIQERGDQAGPPPRRPRWQRWRDALYFSLNTFTTVGYGDWYPTDDHLRLGRRRLPFIHFRTIAMIEGLVGWILITLFIISLGKTWIR
ncbi:MAG: hypothetical protein GKR89_26895 [Candidatus Latescibacteria bacterium]|nr:hypothetical protein [Candidatus Latescibacterota bacterium]